MLYCMIVRMMEGILKKLRKTSKNPKSYENDNKHIIMYIIMCAKFMYFRDKIISQYFHCLYTDSKIIRDSHNLHYDC